MKKHYTSEKNSQVIVSLLKQHGISRVIASPGTTNMALVASLQQDSFFDLYSSVDERSAAYMACGLAEETGEPVVISCTGATASRNYLSGLTEAYYRKLPVLAVTSTQAVSRVGHHIAQVIDRSQMPKDTVRLSVSLPIVKGDDDVWDCEIKVNQAILELKRGGGGPAHINLPTTYSGDYSVEELPEYRLIQRYTSDEKLPEMVEGRIAIFIGAHKKLIALEIEALERFCLNTGAVVFCDHTSGYSGKFKLHFSLASGQQALDLAALRPALMIHIGEVSGDYYNSKIKGEAVWRVSPDGEIRDTFRKLTAVFEMSETAFFDKYAPAPEKEYDASYFNLCSGMLEDIRSQIPELPFSNIWMASQLSSRIPSGSTIHFGILNSLRSWNFYELPEGVMSASNVGGFGIDGGMSSLLGASLANPQKPYFLVIGDLAFFYDMNSLGNRHLGSNLRILLINNGKGTEFRNYGHVAHHFGSVADEFISAARHFGDKSPALAKNYVEALGFDYSCARNKAGFEENAERFLQEEISDKPLLLEVFTDSDDESKALEIMINISTDSATRSKEKLKGVAKQMLGSKGIKLAKKIIK